MEEVIGKIEERLKGIEKEIRDLVKRREEMGWVVGEIEKIKGIGFWPAVNLFLFF